jgi:ubiquinol-cytochrome c reductase cytochrome c subunit
MLQAAQRCFKVAGTIVAIALAIFPIAARAQDQNLIKAGRGIYETRCIQCHGANLQGTESGPNLHGVGPAALDFMMRTGRMPLEVPDTEALPAPPQLTPQEIEAVIAFAVTNGAGDNPPIPQVKLNDHMAQGRKLYEDNCQPCHGAQGTGAIVGFGWEAPDLHPDNPASIAEAVRVGPGVMPHFDTHQLSDNDLNDVVSYVMTFRHSPDYGGYALGHTGPTGEGMAAWIFGMGTGCVVMVLVGETLKSRRQPNRDSPR